MRSSAKTTSAEAKKTRKFRSLTVTLAVAFLALSALVLLMASGLNSFFEFKKLQDLIASQQQLVAQNAAERVRAFIQQKLDILEKSVALGSLATAGQEEQKLILEKLLGKELSFRQLVLLNTQEQELSRISRISKLLSARLMEYDKRELFATVSQKKNYISSIYIDKISSEPMIIMAVPVTDIFNDFKGILLAEVNLKFMWDLIDSIKIGNKGFAYVVDRKGNLIAFKDISRVLKGENLKRLSEVNKFVGREGSSAAFKADVSRGILDGYVVSTHAPLGTPDWAVVVELPVMEAYRPVFEGLGLSAGAMLMSFILAILSGVYLSRRITRPIIALRDATKKVSKGDMSVGIEIESKNEIGELAASFNQMVMDLHRTTVSIDELKKEQKRFQDVAMNIGEWIWEIDDEGRYIYSSPAVETILGYRPEEVAGRHFYDFFHPDERDGLKNAALEVFSRKEIFHGFVHRNVHKDGHIVILETSGVPVLSSEGELLGYRGADRDVTERRKAEENLLFMATHDLLTNLPNRTILSDRLRQAIARARRYGHILAVILIDLDHFKDINDTLGHSFGDLLLKSVASRLKSRVRESDTVVRLGGDEFVVVLTDIAEADGVKTVASRLMDAFTLPFILENHELRITLSMGISTFPSDGGTMEELLKYADLALYRAKDSGRNNYQLYTPEIESALSERVKLEADLHGALERNEFELFYQPIYDLGEGGVVTVEALLRWHHPRQGMVSPASFIPIAEKTGLIIPIGQWVLQAACRQNKQWQEWGLPAVSVAVNISTRQFMQPDLAETIEQILSATGLESRHLELEITESAAMANIDMSIRVIDRLRERGIRFIIDDFGSGYSSLGWLKLLSVRALKIDRLFIQNITSDPYDAAIVKAIILMAHSMGIQVVAEGVETTEQLDFLRALRWEAMPSLQCDRVQGFLLDRPMPAADLARVLGVRGTHAHTSTPDLP